jgi:4-hydroxy-3-methylbut-2-enyl diphosphate reductase
LEVIVAKSAGFCFGVKRAVEMAYSQAGNENVYTFGPIIHNEEVIKDLEKKGVKVIEDDNEIDRLPKGTMIVRAHGIRQEEYRLIEEAGHKITDATCPFVLKIHKIVKEAAERNEFVVIIGDEKHPEVQGIKSCAKDNSVVLDNENAVKEFLESGIFGQKQLCIVSQTTFNLNKFKYLVEIFRKNSYININVLNTICNATEERQAEAAALAATVDAMIVIGGRSSSNTQKLYEICKEVCDNTFYIQTAEDMDYSKLCGMNRVGITAGASTPHIIIEEVQTKCQI